MIIKLGTKVLAVELPRTMTRPNTIHEVEDSPCEIHIEDDKVTKGKAWTQKSIEGAEGRTSIPITSIVILASSLELYGSSKQSPSCTTKLVVVGDSPTSKGTSLSREVQPKISFKVMNHAALDNFEVSTDRSF